MSTPQDESLQRWQGRLDVFVEITEKRIETLFEALEVEKNRIQLLDDELKKDILELRNEFTTKCNTLATALSNLTARLTVIAAIGSFLGTVVTSLMVAAIIKVFMK